MNRSRRAEFGTAGILAVVCLLLLNVLVRQLRQASARKFVVAVPAASVSVVQSPSPSSSVQYEPNRSEAEGSSKAATKRKLQPQAQDARHPPRSEQVKPTVLLQFPERKSQAAALPQPKTLTLEPLGYVEKGDGRVEAIISLGDHVHVVHEGEIFEDHFRVAKVSSSAVELVENLTPSAEESQLTAEIGPGVAQAAAGPAPQMPPPPVPGAISGAGASGQTDADSASSGTHPSVRQELGYVERADGRVEAIVAEEDHVRLTPATKTFASNFRIPEPPLPNLEVADASPAPTSPPDSIDLELQPVHTNSPTGAPSLIALGPEPSTLDERQGIPAGQGEPQRDPLGLMQPEPLAEYSGSRFEPRDIAPAPHAGLAESGTSAGTMETGQALEGSASTLHPSDAKGSQSMVNTLGYVEKADGEKEAIVEILGQVYLVHEGELFAGKYRALQVTPSSVQIVEEPLAGASLPSELESDFEEACPPISGWRAPPYVMDSSGTDLPTKVDKANEFAAGEPVVSPPRPPPEQSVKYRQVSQGAKNAGMETKAAGAAKPLAQTDTHSPPCALKTIGSVEKANGETETIVADEGDVYLVPSGSAFLASPKIANLPLTVRFSQPLKAICPLEECQTPHRMRNLF